MRLNDQFSLPFNQSEVDFVIPNLSADIPLAIDPFLLYKSRDDRLRDLHADLVAIFNRGIQGFLKGSRDELDYLVDFPEVDEIGFGYSDAKIKGTGLGRLLNNLLVETLIASPDLQLRGLEHVEELQLISIGVGPDRISDIAGNALKSFLIAYTQRQAALWDIPMVPGLPVKHIFDVASSEWYDDYYDLPQNPVSGSPILLVPRRIVRQLPWMNYLDYVRSDFRMFLQASTPAPPPRSRRPIRTKYKDPPKRTVVRVTRQKLDLVEQYVDRKVKEGDQAEPSLGGAALSQAADFETGEALIRRLRSLPSGQSAATDYQRLVYEILNYLFEPDLTDGQMEPATHQRTERRDIIYTNESEKSFLKHVREVYGSQQVLFEAKNVNFVELDHINQVAAYLGAKLGMLGFIVTRNDPGQNIMLKTYAIYNDTPSMPRKMILILTDDTLITMIRLKQKQEDPAKLLQHLHREFRLKVQ